MLIDPHKLVEQLKKRNKGTRGRVTLYLDQELVAAFRKLCHPVAPSRVVEEFIREFVESSKKKR